MENWKKYVTRLVSQPFLLFVFLVCSLFIVGCGGDKKPVPSAPQASTTQPTQPPNKSSSESIKFFLAGENRTSAQDSSMESLLKKNGIVKVDNENEADLVFAPGGEYDSEKRLADITKIWVVISLRESAVTASSVRELKDYISQNKKIFVFAKNEWGKPDNLSSVLQPPIGKDIAEIQSTQAEIRLISKAEYITNKSQYKTYNEITLPQGELTQKRSIYLRRDNFDKKEVFDKLRLALKNPGYELSNSNIESASSNQVSINNRRLGKIEQDLSELKQDRIKRNEKPDGWIKSHIDIIIVTLVLLVFILTIFVMLLFFRGGAANKEDSYFSTHRNSDAAIDDFKKQHWNHKEKIANIERNIAMLHQKLDEYRRLGAESQKTTYSFSNEPSFPTSNTDTSLKSEHYPRLPLVNTIDVFAVRVAEEYNNALKDDHKQDDFKTRYRPTSYEVANANDIRQNPLGTMPVFKSDPAGKYMFISFNDTNLYLVMPIFKTKLRKVNWVDGAMQIAFRNTKGFDETKYYSDVRVVSPAIYSEQNMTMKMEKSGELELGFGEKIS